jgi:hypothetical protein
LLLLRWSTAPSFVAKRNEKESSLLSSRHADDH